MGFHLSFPINQLEAAVQAYMVDSFHSWGWQLQAVSRANAASITRQAYGNLQSEACCDSTGQFGADCKLSKPGSGCHNLFLLLCDQVT